MKYQKQYWLIGGAINLFTALLHTIGGEVFLVNPMLQSNLEDQVKAEWFGAWHMVTIVLVMSIFLLLKNAVVDTPPVTNRNNYVCGLKKTIFL